MARRGRPDLKRRRAKRQPERKFYIICEGQRTEPEYFDALRKVLGPTRIEFVFSRAAGVPLTIAEIAERTQKEQGLNKGSRQKLSSFEKADEVWAVFDRDTHPNYQRAKDKCAANGIGIAYSDPCFELWINLHCCDADKPCTHREVQRETEGLVEGYDRRRGKTGDWSGVIQNLADAEGRAEIMMKRREEEANPEGNPSTSVHLLVNSIRTAAEKSKR